VDSGKAAASCPEQAALAVGSWVQVGSPEVAGEFAALVVWNQY